MKWKEDHHSYMITQMNFAIVKRKPEKKSGLFGIRTLLSLRLTGVAL